MNKQETTLLSLDDMLVGGLAWVS